MFSGIHLFQLISEGTWDAYIFADNDDGSDLKVTVQKGLTAILDWKAGDLNEDHQLNSADLIQMKRMLLS